MLKMPVGEMLERMSSSEMTEWYLYLKWKQQEQEKAERAARGRR
jgi:hypothetical protein